MSDRAYRRSAALVSYWQDRRLVLHNYATNARVACGPSALEVLDYCSDWRTERSVCHRFERYGREGVASLLRDLVRHSLLRRSDRPAAPAERAFGEWNGWNPAAGFFHQSTKDVAYPASLAAAAESFAAHGPRRPMPPPAKRYARVPRTTLPSDLPDSEFSRVLRERRTWRRFSKRPVSAGELSTLLKLTWGVQRRAHVDGQGDVFLKTSPSGGARHPGEVYVLALNVRGLPRGLYHYRCDRHQLARLNGRASAKQVSDYLPGQRWYAGAAALLLMTAIFGREQWRYQFARAYRAVLIEAGHLCQTFCLAATWLGLAPFCSMALADSRIERDLGIDGVRESILYVAGVAARPVDDSTPWHPER